MRNFEIMLRRELIGTTLGICRFFEPKPKFARYMKTLKTPIIDVGAGAGHVTKFLLDAGVQTVGIDMHCHMEPVYPVHMADGADFPYPEGCAVMLCRPCHGAFTQQVIDQAIARKVGMVLYVGLDRNVEDDLDDYFPRFKRVSGDVGEEDESIWRMEL